MIILAFEKTVKSLHYGTQKNILKGGITMKEQRTSTTLPLTSFLVEINGGNRVCIILYILIRLLECCFNHDPILYCNTITPKLFIVAIGYNIYIEVT